MNLWNVRRRAARLARCGIVGLEAIAGAVLGLAVCRPSAGRPRVAFQAYASYLAADFGPLIAHLKADGHVETLFVVVPHPDYGASERRRLRAMATEQFGFDEDNVVPLWKTLWWDIDLCIAADVSAVFPFRPTHRCLLMHGVAIGLREFRPHPLRPRLADFDSVIVGGQHDGDTIRDQIQDTRHPPRVYVTGLPTFDRFHGKPSPPPAQVRSGGPPKRPVVLVAPHWRDFRGEAPPPDVRLDQVIAGLRRLPVQVVLKPHYLMLRGAAGARVDWASTFDAYERSGLEFDWEPDDYEALAHADVLVTGRSSRALGFMLMDKPVVLYPTAHPDDDPIQRRRQTLIASAARQAPSFSSVAPLVDEALRTPADGRRQRQRVADLFYANVGSATERTCEALYAELGLIPLRSPSRRQRTGSAPRSIRAL
ncbi:CDP-glycerol glycerophosphotransferase family protein [Rubrivirga sp. IMCC43871]|uniref:CDP-glycerol glycerophosphotransferase family protein n=1 Tax=Rubrivirga sp. IMCC43871 TaxID=3391575 RepID=UPI0039900D7C